MNVNIRYRITYAVKFKDGTTVDGSTYCITNKPIRTNSIPKWERKEIEKYVQKFDNGEIEGTVITGIQLLSNGRKIRRR